MRRKPTWYDTYPRWDLVLRARQKFPGYSGELAEPLYVNQDEWPPKSAPTDQVHRLPTREQLYSLARVEGRARARLESLFEFFEVEPGDWEKLAWALIYWHVPGLTITDKKPGRRPGAPRKRSLANDEALVVHIAELRSELAVKKRIEFRKVPVSEAIRASIKREPQRWAKPKGGGTMSLASATARFHESRNRIRGASKQPAIEWLGFYPTKIPKEFL